MCLFGVVFGVRSAVFGLHFGARCVERRSWGRFRCTVRLFGFDFGALPFRDRFWCVVRWCWGRSQPAGNKIYQDWRGPGGNRARDLSNMGPWSWRMMPFRVDFGARCAFSGSVLVCGAPFLGWILVRGAPFLGWILVRGMWCADFEADFGARCVVFGLDFGARCAVFLGSILVRGVWCADFRADFGARCAFLGSFLVCGAPFLGSILVHGVWCADFGGFRCTVHFLGSILARCLFGIDWCADVGVDHSQRATRSIQIGEDLGGTEPETCRIWGLGPGAWCPFGWILVRGAPFRVGFWCAVRRFWARFWCAVRRFWARFWCAVCGAPIFGPISVHGAPFWARKIGEDLGGIEPETCRIWGFGLGTWCPFGWILVRGAPFRARFWCAVRRFWGGFWCAVRRFWAGFWCAVCGAPILRPISVHGASFLGSILVRGAPFLGSILVRGVWCADFRADFGARCAFFGLDFGARCVVRRFSGRFRCTVCLFGIVFGVWRAVFGLDFGARCVVRRFWGGFRCTVRLFGFDFGALPFWDRFWDRFWCVVRWCWGRSQPAGNKIYQNMNILLFSALLGAS